MKLALVVADGVHKGKAIPIVVPQFLIGRDEQCQLRPASQAISKQHCAILIREGQVYIKDFGSTNGTFLNQEKVDGERQLHHGDHLIVGPLSFKVNLEVSVPSVGVSADPNMSTIKDSDPSLSKGSNPDLKKSNPPAAKPKVKAVVAEEAKSRSALDSDAGTDDESGPQSDRIAALLLGLDADDEDESGTPRPPEIPEGSTILDMPALDENGQPKKVEAKAPPQEQKANSNVANEILKKYQRRPRG